MIRFTPLGDRAVTVTLGDTIDEATHARVRATVGQLDRRPPRGLIEQVPAYASVAVHYDPRMIDVAPNEMPYDAFVASLRTALSDLPHVALPAPRVVDIPVCYGGALGPDLDEVARQHSLTADDVVRLHTSVDYLVYMIGFLPGFGYLGGLPEQLVTPRRATPRTVVPAGSVGIGGNQTGVYSLDSPGGWNLIGRTPLQMFNVDREPPSLLAAGDHVRFRAITPDELERYAER